MIGTFGQVPHEIEANVKSTKQLDTSKNKIFKMRIVILQNFLN